MFYLKDLPSDEVLNSLSQRYDYMDPSAVKACLRMLRTGSDMLTSFENMLARHGLSQGRFLVLQVMNRTPDEEALPSSLAERIGVSRATMTGLLDGLEREGLITRHAHPEDRRKTSLRMTQKGREVLDGMLPDYYGRIKGLMQDLSVEERNLLVGLLGKISANLAALTKE